MNLYNEVRIRTGRLLPRRFHCYCLGAAKTATTSVSAMFKNNFDTCHEPDIKSTNHHIIDYLEERISAGDIRDYIVARDKRFKLEMESTHSLIYISRELAEIFPSAKFIVTVREPLSWIRSRINFHFKKHPQEWEEYRQYFWMDRTKGYAEEERSLEEHGLASLDAYLEQYADHYQLAMANLPSDRRLFITTDQISDETSKIADFLNIKSSLIKIAHSNAEPDKATFIDEIDKDFLLRKVWMHCESTIRQFFPERVPFYEENMNQLGSNNSQLTRKEP